MGGGREPYAYLSQDRASDVQASVDVTADKHLLGGAALELDSPSWICASGRLEIDIGRVRRTSGIRKRSGQPLLPLEADWRVWCELNGAPIERRGPIEGECGNGFPRSKGCLGRGADVITGPSVMCVERLAVVATPRDKCLHHERVDLAHGARGHLRGERFANPIVVGLDSFR